MASSAPVREESNSEARCWRTSRCAEEPGHKVRRQRPIFLWPVRRDVLHRVERCLSPSPTMRDTAAVRMHTLGPLVLRGAGCRPVRGPRERAARARHVTVQETVTPLPQLASSAGQARIGHAHIRHARRMAANRRCWRDWLGRGSKNEMPQGYPRTCSAPMH